MKTPTATNSLVLGRVLTRHARYRSKHTAVVFDGQRLTYQEFNALVNKWANTFNALGVCHGDRVATILPNTLELLVTYWACAKIGAVAVPLSPLLLEEGIVSLLQDAEPKVVLSNQTFGDILAKVRSRLECRPAPTCVFVDEKMPGFESGPELIAAASDAEPDTAVEADDLVAVMYTSGTTGMPKGIMHTHFIRAMYAGLLSGSWRMGPESTVLHTGAIIFNGAMLGMFPSFYSGAKYVLHQRFDVDAMFDAIERERVTHMVLVPTQITEMLQSPRFDPERLQSLEMILSIGAPLAKPHKDQLMADLPNRFYELYGLTEGFITVLDREDAVSKAGSVGVPPPFYEMRIVDENGAECEAGVVGEILGRGPITMVGYANRPDLTEETIRDGWIYSGDLGYVDEDGYLYLVDRKKDMIDSGGVKVYPRDVEDVVIQHPDVSEVAVFGIPHEKWGETPLAAVVLKPGHETSPDTLREWINTNVSARYQRVSRVKVMEKFPRNAAGKTLKREMRMVYWDDQESKI